MLNYSRFMTMVEISKVKLRKHTMDQAPIEPGGTVGCTVGYTVGCLLHCYR